MRKKKLRLKTETVKSLTDTLLRSVAGGAAILACKDGSSKNTLDPATCIETRYCGV